MPIWFIAVLTAYALHLFWQARRIYRTPGISPSESLGFLLFGLVKVGLVVVAASFWSSRYCTHLNDISSSLLILAIFLGIMEIVRMRSPTVETLQKFRGTYQFYIIASAQVIVSIILPAVLIVYASRVVLFDQCAP